jgi:hypothetical protein
MSAREAVAHRRELEQEIATIYGVDNQVVLAVGEWLGERKIGERV